MPKTISTNHLESLMILQVWKYNIYHWDSFYFALLLAILHVYQCTNAFSRHSSMDCTIQIIMLVATCTSNSRWWHVKHWWTPRSDNTTNDANLKIFIVSFDVVLGMPRGPLSAQSKWDVSGDMQSTYTKSVNVHSGKRKRKITANRPKPWRDSWRAE
jgi:hypothetical protein